MWSRLRLEGRGLALGAALLVVAGCYWLRYADLAQTHADLLSAMAVKLGQVTAVGPPPGSMAEYRYPLRRARDFIRIVGPRDPNRPSLLALTRLCNAYDAVLAAADGLRRTDPAPGARAALEQQLALVEQEAAAVRTALATERRTML